MQSEINSPKTNILSVKCETIDPPPKIVEWYLPRLVGGENKRCGPNGKILGVIS